MVARLPKVAGPLGLELSDDGSRPGRPPADLAFYFVWEGRKMTIREAKSYIGKDCSITWRNRMGKEQKINLHIHDLTFVPLYGAYLVGDIEDVCLDRVTRIQPIG